MSRPRSTRRTILLFAAVPVLALVIGVGVGLASLLPSPSSSAPVRMTHEQLVEAAAKPDAAEQYDYYFSQEELAAIAPHIKPWNCVPGMELSEADQYHCGVDAIFVPNSLHYVPPGYMYEGALMGKQSHKLAGIRIVRTAAWQPSVKSA